jgi:hypothetical protein
MMAKLPVEKLKVSKGKPPAPVPVKIVDVPTNSTSSNKDYEAEERKRKARYALEDIERAEGHKRDASLMKDVRQCAKEKLKTYKGL